MSTKPVFVAGGPTAQIARVRSDAERTASALAYQARMNDPKLVALRAAQAADAQAAEARKNTTQYTPPVDTEMAAAAVALAGNGR